MGEPPLRHHHHKLYKVAAKAAELHQAIVPGIAAIVAMRIRSTISNRTPRVEALSSQVLSGYAYFLRYSGLTPRRFD
jgi:hypothetical protein